MGHYSALNGKGILTHATIWMNCEDMMPRETSQSQKTNKYTQFHLSAVPRTGKFTETEVFPSCCGLGSRGWE